MRKSRKIEKIEQSCGLCSWATPVYEHWNLDHKNHAPICLKCPFVTNRLVIRSEKGCEKFKMK